MAPLLPSRLHLEEEENGPASARRPLGPGPETRALQRNGTRCSGEKSRSAPGASGTAATTQTAGGLGARGERAVHPPASVQVAAFYLEKPCR